MDSITVEHLTKDYGGHRGIFDLNFSIPKGEVFGFLGPNGAGKTTTIRHLMGFIRPDGGSAEINGIPCFTGRPGIQKKLGYLPGEIACMEEMKGEDFLCFMARLKQMKDLARMRELMEYFELEADQRIRKMSKGTKQKIGIICAFMQSPEILLLDEPTSGLDPLMQNRFVELVLEEKKRGATIFLSSHIFDEIERTCDRAAFIREGRLIAAEEMETLRHARKKVVTLTFSGPGERQRYLDSHADAGLAGENQAELCVSGDMDRFIKELGRYTVKDVTVRTQSLEELFLHFYGGESHE